METDDEDEVDLHGGVLVVGARFFALATTVADFVDAAVLSTLFPFELAEVSSSPWFSRSELASGVVALLEARLELLTGRFDVNDKTCARERLDPLPGSALVTSSTISCSPTCCM